MNQVSCLGLPAESIRHKIGIIVSFYAIIILAGCSSVSHTYLLKKELNDDIALHEATLEVALDEDRFISVSLSRNSGGGEALSGSLTAAYQSTPPPAGTSAGEMAAAYVLTTYLIRSGMESNLAAEANDRVSSLVNRLQDKGTKARLVDMIREHFKVMKSVDIMYPEDDLDRCVNNIKLIPRVKFSTDLRSVEVKADFVVNDNTADSIVYRNSFVYLAAPVPPDSTVSTWADNDADLLFQTIDEAFVEIVKMIDRDLSPPAGSMDNTKVSTIKYRNELGTFYERGMLLEQTEGRLLLRDLRGNLRSVTGRLL